MMDTNEKQPFPASRTYDLIQDGEQTHAHLFVTCQLYSLVRPQCVVSCVVSWPLYLVSKGNVLLYSDFQISFWAKSGYCPVFFSFRFPILMGNGSRRNDFWDHLGGHALLVIG